MKTAINQKGFIDPFTLLAVFTVVGALLFIPNPVSSSLGIGIRPNKTVQAESTTQTLVPAKADGETLYYKDGSVAMVSQTVYKHKDLDLQQKVSLWEQFRSLPILWLILSLLGAAGVPALGFMVKFNKGVKNKFLELTEHHEELEGEVKTIIRAVDEAFATIPMTLAAEKLPGEVDRAVLAKKIADGMLNVLKNKYDKSTKDLVRELRSA